MIEVTLVALVMKAVIKNAGSVTERFRRKPQRETVRIILKYKDLVESATDLREAYYIVRNFVAQEASRETYDWLSKKEGYEYFAHEILDRLEAWGYISKPPAKPIGFYIKEGVQHFIADIVHENLDIFKGIIFVEKESVAKQLSPLSELGYVIMAGQGFPTRLMREVAKRGKLFVMHDADKAGYDIYRVFTEGAKRLKKISEDYALRWIAKRAKDLGLSKEDAERMGLDPEPEAGKYRKYGLRYELQALIKLKVKYGIENPYTAYAFYKLEKMGEDLKPAILEPEEMYARKATIMLSLLLHKKLAEVAIKNARELVQHARQKSEPILDGFRLRKDLLERITIKSLNDLALEIVRSAPTIEVSDWDCTVIIGGISDFSDAGEFLSKFKEKYGVYKIYALLG